MAKKEIKGRVKSPDMWKLNEIQTSVSINKVYWWTASPPIYMSPMAFVL